MVELQTRAAHFDTCFFVSFSILQTRLSAILFIIEGKQPYLLGWNYLMVSFKIKELLYRFTLFLSMVGFVFSTTMAFVPSTVKAQVEQPELTNTEYFSQEVVQTENGDILIETYHQWSL